MLNQITLLALYDKANSTTFLLPSAQPNTTYEIRNTTQRSNPQQLSVNIAIENGSNLQELQKNMHWNLFSKQLKQTKIYLEFSIFRIVDLDVWYKTNVKFDVISCLNLLDRCDTPLELLQQIKSALAPDGRVLLALVLPFSAYVESGKCFCLLFVQTYNGKNFFANCIKQL